MSLPRITGGVLSLVYAASLFAQETAEVADSLVNWAAPPYWSAQQAPAKDVEGVLQEGREPGIQPMGALPSAPLPFTAITPCRIVDTRGAHGLFGGPALVANAGRTFTLPAGPCPGLPGDAGAWSLNFTVIGGSGTFQAAFLTAWPTGSPQPLVSTLNFNANQLVANAAVVPAGTSGAIDVFVNAPAHLLIDINGYYRAAGIVHSLNGLFGAVSLAPGANITITPSGQTLTIANTAPAAWRLTGNSGTTPGTNFLGTTDAQPLELKVNGARVFRLEANATIAGHSSNAVTAGVVAGTIAGGGQMGESNLVTDSYGTVGGGVGNQAGDNAGTTTDFTYATVSGGKLNIASGSYSTIGGGYGNLASGFTSMIPGGNQNRATGIYSFAAGHFAQSHHSGAWVWGDDTFSAITSTGANQFIVRASGGIFLGSGNAVVSIPAGRYLNTYTGGHLTTTGIWTNNSDAFTKENFEPVDRQELLARLVQLPMSTWSYKADKGAIRHIGPMAQDFTAAFAVGNDDRSISTLDADGVALAAIQALYAEVQELRRRLAALEAEKD